MRRAAIGLACALTRALLRLYPASFRQDMGGDMVRHVRRRAEEIEGPLWPFAMVAWLVRLSGSLVINAIGAWREHRRSRPGMRPIARVPVSSLDFKLGLRMLVRFPGLTLVAGMAIAYTIGLGAGTFQFLTDWFAPTMPFEGGDRIVELWNDDRETGRPDPRVLHDYLVWRDEMSTVAEIGALRTFQRNLITERGGSAPLIGAEISITAFEIARTPPILGRLLLPSDEVPGSPEVVLLSHEVWQNRFGGDPGVVGTTVRLGSEIATVVGVMPEGFGWPRGYRLWTALQVDPLASPRGEGPSLQVLGKLAPGASLSEAQAELATIGARLASDHPESNAHLAPSAQRYGALDLGVGELMVLAFRSISSLGFLGLIILVCGNVALLLFARTASRQSEIVVRGALGASRGRIVTQLFAEALVLGLASGAVGLVVASVGYAWLLRLFHSLAPGMVGYWFDGRLNPSTVLYAIVFTLLAAVISGVLPALKATGQGFHSRLQRVGTSGPGLEFGRLWSAIIIGQIAVTVAFVPIIGLVGHGLWEMGSRPLAMAVDEYLMAELRYPLSTGVLDDIGPAIGSPGYSPEFAAAHAEVKRRLELEDGVSAVTVAQQVPGAPQPPGRVVMEGPSAPLTTTNRHYTSVVSVDVDFFGALGARIVAGRGFAAADDVPEARVAIVDEVFVRQILEDRSAVGRRFELNRSYTLVPSPLVGEDFEIIGVVSRIEHREAPFEEAAPFVYMPLGATEAYPVRLAMRVGPDPTDFAARLRQIVAEVDPELILTQVRSLEDADWATRQSFESWFWVLLAMGGMGITLAMAGLYSILSFTVSKRTREIGVRVALGADHLRVIWPILGRALKQIGIGSAIGALIFWGVIMGSDIRSWVEPWHVAVFPAYLVGLTALCGTACIVPARRALSIEPTEALRAEG